MNTTGGEAGKAAWETQVCIKFSKACLVWISSLEMKNKLDTKLDRKSDELDNPS